MAPKVPKNVRRRSPKYPFIPLPYALQRIDRLWREIGQDELAVEAARQIWGYSMGSSGGIQVEAALRSFGLLDVVGRGPQRRLKVSRLGLDLLDGSRAPGRRAELLRSAALSPRIHRELWDRWQDQPDRSKVQEFLVQRGFQRRGAEKLIAEYTRTVEFMLDEEQTSISQPVSDEPALNKPEVRLRRDGLVSVAALVDLDGLVELMELLQAHRTHLEKRRR